MNNKHLTDLDWELLRKQRSVRLKISGESFYWFFHLYFGHYIKYPTAEFQKEMITLASDPDVEQLVIVAFRESGKSTIITTALPLWAITGHLQRNILSLSVRLRIRLSNTWRILPKSWRLMT